MRVLQLGPWPPPHGGVQTNLVAIRRLLLEKNIPCEVINLTRFRANSGEGIYYPANSFELMRLLFRLRYDLLHLHVGGSLPLRLVCLGLVCTLIPRARSVFTFHSGGYPGSKEGRAARPFTLRGFVFRRFNAIIAVNAELLDMFRRFGVPRGRLRLISPHSLPEERDALPPLLGAFFGSHEPVLAAVAGLEPEYDLPLQMEVMGEVVKAFPRAGLAIIGSGSLESELKGVWESKPWKEHILLCGDVPHAATLRAMSEAAIMLRTTHYDGDSISVREALALGTPVIATDNGMRPEGVHLIPRGDATALFRTIRDLLTTPPPRTTQSGTGGRNIEAVLSLYRELLAG